MQPLHLAALYDEPEIMEMILDTLGASAPVDGADAHGRTPLFLAAANSSRECVRILLERGADPSISDAERVTPFHAAAASGSPEVMEALFKSADDLLEATTAAGRTAFHYAMTSCESRGSSAVDFLLLMRANPFAQDNAGVTPVHLACQLQVPPSTLRDLLRLAADLSMGALINVSDSAGRTPLHVALQAHSEGCLTELLTHAELDITAPDARGLSPLHTAVLCAFPAGVEALLAKGGPALLAAADGEGRTAVHAAAALGDDTTLRRFGAGAHLTAGDGRGRPPLHYAAMNEKEDSVDALLELEVPEGAADRDGATALHWAAAAGSRRLLKTLAKAGGMGEEGARLQVDQADAAGRTALMMAAGAGSAEAVDYLLSKLQVKHLSTANMLAAVVEGHAH
jgi:ankyrin repeat protein